MPKYASQDPCVACGESYLDRCLHHVTSQGAGGKDTPDNLMGIEMIGEAAVEMKRGVRKGIEMQGRSR